MGFDYILKQGTVIDGTGKAAYVADLGITGAAIGRIGDLSGQEAGEIIDVSGFVVCPGLIDAHCHTDMYAAQVPEAEGKIMQGVTTDVCGLCGDSPAPIGSAHLEEYRAGQNYRLEGEKEIVPIRFSEYVDSMTRAGNTTNMALFVGNTNLRVHAIGYEHRRADKKELDVMRGMLREAMEEGARGLSTGLTYVPSGFSDTKELIELCRVIAPYGGIYNSHMRDEGDGVLDAIREVIQIAGESGCAGHISHLKVSGKKNHGLSGRCLELIHRANESGISITFDVYPYTAGSCGLKSLLPPDILESGAERDLEMMRKPVLYEQIRKKMLEENWENMLARYGAECITVAAADGDPRYEGKTIREIADEFHIEEIDAVIQVLGETGGRASMIYHALSEQDLITFMKDPLCMIGTDAFARRYTGPTAYGKPHPRNYGGFPRMIRTYLLNEKVLPLEEGIRRMTSLPASRFSIEGRGSLAPGAVADLLVFDPETIREMGSYMEPARRPQGIRWVFLNGKPAVENGEFHDLRLGRVLKRR